MAIIASPLAQFKPPLIPHPGLCVKARRLREEWKGWTIEGCPAWLELEMVGEAAITWNKLWSNNMVCKNNLSCLACGARPDEFDTDTRCRLLHAQPSLCHAW